MALPIQQPYFLPANVVLMPDSGGTGLTPVQQPAGKILVTDGGGFYTFGGGGALAGFGANETPAGAINDVNAAFTLAAAPSPQGSLMLFLNRVLQILDTDYTLAGLTITYVAAPQTGDIHHAWYRF